MTVPQTFPSLIDESARRRFEAAWQSGRPELIEAFLPPEGDPRYLATLEELVAIDLELSGKARRERTLGKVGAAPSSEGIEEYLLRFPRLNQPDIVQRLRHEQQAIRHAPGSPDSPKPQPARCGW